MITMSYSSRYHRHTEQLKVSNQVSACDICLRNLRWSLPSPKMPSSQYRRMSICLVIIYKREIQPGLPTIPIIISETINKIHAFKPYIWKTLCGLEQLSSRGNRTDTVYGIVWDNAHFSRVIKVQIFWKECYQLKKREEMSNKLVKEQQVRYQVQMHQKWLKATLLHSLIRWFSLCI